MLDFFHLLFQSLLSSQGILLLCPGRFLRFRGLSLLPAPRFTSRSKGTVTTFLLFICHPTGR
uniref:Uncharacterized protein n=1 Tax=Naja naja TaxID=35670 RepID=A0A8C6VM17_NAJNA